MISAESMPIGQLSNAQTPVLQRARQKITENAEFVVVATIIASIACPIFAALGTGLALGLGFAASGTGLLIWAHLGTTQPNATGQVVGITNRGNTCFIASVLQSLKPEEIAEIRDSKKARDEYPELHFFLKTYCDCQKSGKTFHQIHALRRILKLEDGPTSTRQGDAAGVLEKLLECLPNTPILLSQYSIEICPALIEDSTPQREPIAIIPLSLNASQSTHSVPDLLRNFAFEPCDKTEIAVMTKTDTYRGRLTQKTMKFEKKPTAFTLQIKRFAYDGIIGESTKISTPLDGSLSTIELPQECLAKVVSPDSRKFSLAQVIVHLGHSPTSGHYISYVRKLGPQGEYKWYKCNDSQISEVPDAFVEDQAKQHGYLLRFEELI